MLKTNMADKSMISKIIWVVAVVSMLATGIALVPAGRGSTAVAIGRDESAERDHIATVRGTDFYLLDHELERAGGYDVVPVVAMNRGADFYVLDHELERAGGYDLVPIDAMNRGADFYFVDHELEFAGGYGLVRVLAELDR